MRSSIACARCRRSKVKCINNGVNTTCKACEHTGRECTYPSPAPGGSAGVVRREPNVAVSVQGVSEGQNLGETPRRQRPKKTGGLHPSTSSHHKESPRALVDALDSNILTPKTWDELFQIFQLHYSTDLPFLHPPTFRKSLHHFNLQSAPSDSPSAGQPTAPKIGNPLLLLAFLALTARFHPGLVSYHSPQTRPTNPLVASEYYAAAAKSRLFGGSGEFLRSPNLERVQATLMLGLHEWGMCRGYSAWILVGDAVRAAQALGLQFEHDLDDMPQARSMALNTEAKHLGINPDAPGSKIAAMRGEAFVEQEVKRRTFWSCFIMDRYLSSGKYRPQILTVQDLRIQLPSSDRAFLFGEKVKTEILSKEIDDLASKSEVHGEQMTVTSRRSHEHGISHPSPSVGGQARDERDNARWEVGTSEGALSRFIKALDLYGRIVKWSCAGGRRTEKHPPWDKRTTFNQLSQLLTTLKQSLPSDLTLTEGNTEAHLSLSSSTPYTLMHTLYCLCSIMLHREYVPFLPVRCTKPEGPLDPPVFPPEQYQIPTGFWDDSARECFKSARDIVDLLRMCQQHGKLVETPIVGFAAYTVAFTGVYAINFPQMDPNGYMCKKQNARGEDYGGFEASRSALQLVGEMRPRLQMANGWFRTINRVHRYFRKIRKDFQQNTRLQGQSPESTFSGDTAEYARHLSLREGGAGGGLEEYKLLEMTLKEFGHIEDEDFDMTDAPDADSARLLAGGDDASDAGSGVKSENMDLQDDGTPDGGAARQDRWNAINSSQGIANGQKPGSRGPTSAATANGSSGPFSSAAQPAGAASGLAAFHAQDRRIQQGPTGATPGDVAAWNENRLNSLDTRFGGDDVAAFVSGQEYEDYANAEGWLGTVWGNAQQGYSYPPPGYGAVA